MVKRLQHQQLTDPAAAVSSTEATGQHLTDGRSLTDKAAARDSGQTSEKLQNLGNKPASETATN
ncbi:MAG: hypothetical protein ACLS5K_03480 [Streptococcus salivarius]